MQSRKIMMTSLVLVALSTASVVSSAEFTTHVNAQMLQKNLGFVDGSITYGSSEIINSDTTAKIGGNTAIIEAGRGNLEVNLGLDQTNLGVVAGTVDYGASKIADSKTRATVAGNHFAFQTEKAN